MSAPRSSSTSAEASTPPAGEVALERLGAGGGPVASRAEVRAAGAAALSTTRAWLRWLEGRGPPTHEARLAPELHERFAAPGEYEQTDERVRAELLDAHPVEDTSLVSVTLRLEDRGLEVAVGSYLMARRGGRWIVAAVR